MTINSGTSLDMATLDPNDKDQLDTSIQFVENPDAQEFGNLQNPTKMVFAPEEKEEEIKELQAYFKNPDKYLRNIIGSTVYNGSVNGVMNRDLVLFAHKLETNISNLIENDDVFGVVLKTNANDVKNAVKKVSNYKDYLKNKNLTLDQRFCALSKLV